MTKKHLGLIGLAVLLMAPPKTTSATSSACSSRTEAEAPCTFINPSWICYEGVEEPVYGRCTPVENPLCLWT